MGKGEESVPLNHQFESPQEIEEANKQSVSFRKETLEEGFSKSEDTQKCSRQCCWDEVK